jgi:hypothetical protein
MAKRFTETEKWKDNWFCNLTDNNKLFWLYILDNCNYAGIWEENLKLVQFYIKDFKFDEKIYEGRMIKLKNNKWFIPKFITFQYGKLNPNIKPHLSVINLLKKEDINVNPYVTLTKGLGKGYITPKDKDKDKDQEKDQDKDKDQGDNNKKGDVNNQKQDTPKLIKRFVKPSVDEVRSYCQERNNGIDAEQFWNFYESKDWVVGKSPMKDWRAAVRTWERGRNYSGGSFKDGKSGWVKTYDKDLDLIEQAVKEREEQKQRGG